MEVFILMGLRGVGFVSVADAGVTEARLVQICEIRENRVDSIGFTNRNSDFLEVLILKGLARGLRCGGEATR